MVISINNKVNISSVEQNTTTKSTGSVDIADVTSSSGSHNTNTGVVAVERNNAVHFHLNDTIEDAFDDDKRSSTTPTPPPSPIKQHGECTQQVIDDDSFIIFDTPQSLPDGNNSNLINNRDHDEEDSDDADDDFIKLAQKQANKHRQSDDSSLHPYVEPNNSWNLWNMLFNNHQIVEEIEAKIFAEKNLKISRNFVNIYNNSLRLWTLSANANSKNTPIVLIHGFCGALGLWVHNVQVLSKSRPLYAFDLLGFGRSSRPSFSEDSTVSEQQFIESIEDWRKELNIKEMILLGHSFGGYLASAYAMKYPQYTKALLLIDPWGFQEPPTASRPDTQTPVWVRLISNVSRYVSPLSVLRTTGPIGVPLFKFLKPDFKRKYKSVLGENSDLIYEYLYHCNKEYPSGEDGFRAVAEHYGFAKNPMIKRIEKVSAKIPIWFIYGSRSWVDSTPGFSTKCIRNRFAYVSIKIIPGAGHHVYADKPDLFNDYVDEILDLIDTHDDNTNQNYPTTSSCSSSLLNCN